MPELLMDLMLGSDFQMWLKPDYAPTDHVYEQFGNWFFWDEVDYADFGPYDTEEQARSALRAHLATL